MGAMKEIAAQIEQICEICPSKYCADCKISVKTNGKQILVNGFTRKIEKVERTPNFA